MKPSQIASEEYYGIKILKDGSWLYGGTPILRHNLVKLFSTVLKRDETGDFWLETPYEKGRIEVEDAPFIAVELQAEGAGPAQRLNFRTNVDDWVTAGPGHPLRVGGPRTGIDGAGKTDDFPSPAPYILVRGGLEAKLNRAVYYQLAGIAVPDAADENLFGVWSAGEFFPLGRIEDDDRK